MKWIELIGFTGIQHYQHWKQIYWLGVLNTMRWSRMGSNFKGAFAIGRPVSMYTLLFVQSTLCNLPPNRKTSQSVDPACLCNQRVQSSPLVFCPVLLPTCLYSVTGSSASMIWVMYTERASASSPEGGGMTGVGWSLLPFILGAVAQWVIFSPALFRVSLR